MSVVKIGNEEIKLDPELLKFSEHTINQFLQNYSGHYNFFCEKHAEAMYVNSRHQDRLEVLRSQKFVEFKTVEGGSDKLVEAKVAADPEVQAAQENVRLSKHNANMLYGFLRAMDKAHEDAIQMSYNVRRELASIFPGVKKLES